MWKILSIIPILSIFLFSCNNRNSEHNVAWQQHYNDSIRQDSIIKKNILDSLSLIAIGDAKFGMTKDELRNTDFFMNSKTSYILDSEVTIHSVNIKDKYFGLEAKLANDTLYRITLETNEETANYIDSYLNNAANALGNAFTEKYGEPDYKKTPLNILDLKNGRITTMYRWEVGDKSIIVGIYEYETKPLYKVRCVIEHNKFKDIAIREYAKEKAEREANHTNPL